MAWLSRAHDPTHDAAVATVRAQTYAAHGDDAQQIAEHAAIAALVPQRDATAIAVVTGNWSATTTWHSKKVPVAGDKVLIPSGITVTYDVVSTARIKTVAIDGLLTFSTSTSTKLTVDTIVVPVATGELRIGTTSAPIADGVTAEIVIADNGPINVQWDNLLFSRGIVGHGIFQMCGQTKAPFLQFGTAPAAAATTITLASSAVTAGWKDGDTIIIPGTTYNIGEQVAYDPTSTLTLDEVRTIASIGGAGNTVITLSSALTYDHLSPSGRSDLKGYVANTTRNVRISTENSGSVLVSARGHTMFHHAHDVDIRYVEHFQLGRTNKFVRATKNTGRNTPEINLQGRYPVHFHRMGVDLDGDPAIIIGCSVYGSPGWGFTHHSSFVYIIDCVAYDCLGAGIVQEFGDEIGLWKGNISIRSIGHLHQPDIKPSADVNADVGLGMAPAFFDLGRTGACYWFQGRMIKVEDCIAAGGHFGFAFLHRPASANYGIEVIAANTQLPDLFLHQTDVDVNFPPISHFKRNESFACGYGIYVVKETQNQGHDIRSMFEDFTSWECYTMGVHLEYSAHYTMTNLDVLAAVIDRAGIGKGYGVQFGNNAHDMWINVGTIANCAAGITIPHQLVGFFNGSPGDPWVDTEHGLISVTYSGNTADKVHFDAGIDTETTTGALSPGTLTLVITGEPKTYDWNVDGGGGSGSMAIRGTKTDSIGAVPYTGSDTGAEGPSFYITREGITNILTDYGYWENGADDYVVMNLYFGDRADGTLKKRGLQLKILNTSVAGKTNLGTLDLTPVSPVAVDDTATCTVNSFVDKNVISNDTHADANPLYVDGVLDGANGRARKQSSTTIRYWPNPGWTGVDTFQYFCTDGMGATFGKGTVTVTVS